LVALDERGAAWTTETLAAKLAVWRDAARPVAFVIGGPDGFTDAFRNDADELWQLSRLTLPHALVRVIVAEALYRAWSLLAGHPYHRGGATE
jgi:23S rRNA (pseudouridine1915-N3)-methyltransferase